MMAMLGLIDSPQHIGQTTHPGMMTVKTRSMSLTMPIPAQTHTLNPALGLNRTQIHHMGHTEDTTIIAHITTMTMVTTTMETTTIIDTTTVLQNASVVVQVLPRKTV